MNIRFVGNIGVGKTTAICHLLKLMRDNRPILDTGPGRTTVCDVNIIIQTSEPTSISVEQYNKKEFESILRRLVDNQTNITTEIQTVIKNIVTLGSAFGQNCFEVRKKSFDNNSKFISFCRTQSRYGERNEDFISKPEDELDHFKWIKENFHKINTGKHKHFGIPKEITININESAYGNSYSWYKNKCVTDTKGIETLNRRKQIHQTDKIIFCSSFVNGPENTIVEQIRRTRYVYPWNKFILVLPKYNEPEDVNGADGNYETGVKLKMKEFIRSTREIINPNNILYFDCKRHDQNKLNELFYKITNN